MRSIFKQEKPSLKETNEFESSTFKPQFNFTCLLSLILTFIWSYRRSIWNQFRHAAVGGKIIANGKA